MRLYFGTAKCWHQFNGFNVYHVHRLNQPCWQSTAEAEGNAISFAGFWSKSKVPNKCFDLMMVLDAKSRDHKAITIHAEGNVNV